MSLVLHHAILCAMFVICVYNMYGLYDVTLYHMTLMHRFGHGSELKKGEADNDEVSNAPSVSNSSSSSASSTASCSSSSNPVPESTKSVGKCCGCDVPWSKYRGKKRCVCGVPLLLCSQCIKRKADKNGAKCALCQEDDKYGRKPFNKRMAKLGINPNMSNTEGGSDEADDSGSVNSGGVGAGRLIGNKSKSRDHHVCGVCQEEFKSRNALMKHVQEYRHMNRKRQRR